MTSRTPMATWWFGLSLAAVAAACNGSPAGSPDAAAEHADSPADAAPEDEAAADTDGDTGEAVEDEGPGDDGGGDDGCSGPGALDEPCADDCDCAAGLRCRGLPGETVCSVPCAAAAECPAGVLPGCGSPFCELSVAACRCRCLVAADCPGEHCLASYCVGCGTDDDCASLACTGGPGADVPRCRPDTATCVCGGTCGDGACDEVEATMPTCPGDCAGTCTDGESHPWSCWDGTPVPWCRCEAGAWVCSAEPEATCPGENECGRTGGSCVPDAPSCYEGEILAEPLGCPGDSPLCCRNETCTGPGASYYPGSGRCCPGLVALSSLAPMEGMLPGGGLTCMYGCWALTCTPCGDAVCELHLGENPCNCPRDCPMPPYDLRCTSGDDECGLPYCRMEGDVCRQETPRCAAETCVRDTEDFPGWVCDCSTRSCRETFAVPPPSCPDEMTPSGDACIDRWEASRPDATATEAGSDESRATSRPGVLPWAVNPFDATALAAYEAACAAVGKRLCAAEEWQAACRGPGDLPFVYGPTFDREACSCVDTWCDDYCVTAGIPAADCDTLADCGYRYGCYRMLPTASMPGCTNELGTFDINGNVWEIVHSDTDTRGYEVRGGAFNCAMASMRVDCTFNAGWTALFAGFRCCKDR